MEIKNQIVDAEKAVKGVWVDYDETTAFRIGSTTSRRYKEAYDVALEALRRKTRGKLSTEQAEDLQTNVVAEAIVLDWRGVTNDGATFPCNPTNAVYLLKNCPHVREFILQSAVNLEAFKAERLEEAKASLGESSLTP